LGHHEHKAHAPRQAGVALVTVSTSRSLEDDRSGPVMAELFEAAGHRVIDRRLVTDSIQAIRQAVLDLVENLDVHMICLSGGTGISSQDLTPEAMQPWVKSWLPGFGELFRSLSYSEIGSAAMLSRAALAVCQPEGAGRRVLLAMLPGSPAAVRLAIERLLLPELGHLVYELQR
jgi:molybdenum cofactor biosynthesis protein B